ncbi:hypothetical protein ABZV67_12725 [Streptomyces sp. NPDC005065]
MMQPQRTGKAAESSRDAGEVSGAGGDGHAVVPGSGTAGQAAT